MSAKVRKGSKSVSADDWFSDISDELERKISEISDDYNVSRSKRADINRNLISDFWKIWKTFNKNGILFSIEPNYTAFAQFDDFPYGNWRFKPGFSLDAVNMIQLSDRTHDQGRIGDSLRAFYHREEDKEYLRIIFEHCEGEHYYKYSGWKRIFTQHLLYNGNVERIEMKKIHEIFKKLVKVWFESHLKRDRDYFLKYLANNYEKLKTYSQ
jgi:hypothetical protein